MVFCFFSIQCVVSMGPQACLQAAGLDGAGHGGTWAARLQAQEKEDWGVGMDREDWAT